MKSIIREMYNGNLAPADKSLMSNPKLKKKMDIAGEIEDKLEFILNDEAKKLLTELIEVYTDISILNGEERYIDGFKMGMRFAVESLTKKGRRIELK